MPTKKAPREIVISDFDDYFKKIRIHGITKALEAYVSEMGAIPKTLYRGQPEDKPLLPKLGRYAALRGEELRSTEKNLISEFERTLPSYSDLHDRLNSWDKLALAQHHFLATRLLDWSSNPLIALYFALAKRVNNRDEDNRVIWLLNTTEQESPDFEKGPFEQKRTVVFQPKDVANRIAAQQGWFTCHQIWPTTEQFGDLSQINGFNNKLTKFVIPGAERTRVECLEILDSFGINQKTVFPDIDGLSLHLNWLFLSAYE